MERPTSALLTDHYELTMVASALRSGISTRRSVFEVFARRLPAGRAYGVVAGIDRLLDAVERFRFDDETVAHLIERRVVEEGPMADWLRAYRFTGDITGYAEGELFFPFSPVLTVAGSFAECVVLETVMLSVLNHDCAVASAAARMADAAGGRMLIEGGSRRTDPESAVAAARASHVGGFDTTSNLEAGRRHGIATGGTTAHAFVLAHDTEEAAFAAQRDALGVKSLRDTSRAARTLLDSLGATDCRIVVSSDLDEFRVAELEAAGAPIDAYLVGTSLVTGSGHPTAQMVYKLVSIADHDDPAAPLHAVGKLSPGKRTIGGRKDVHRTFDFDGRYQSEVLSVLPVARPDDSMSPQVSLVLDGEVVADLTDPGEARARCFERRSHLRPQDRTPWPATTPAIPTVWEGVEAPLSAAVANTVAAGLPEVGLPEVSVDGGATQ